MKSRPCFSICGQHCCIPRQAAGLHCCKSRDLNLNLHMSLHHEASTATFHY